MVKMVESPLGPLYLTAAEDGLCGVHYGVPTAFQKEESERAAAYLEQAASQLAAYFSGKLKVFTVALSSQAGTPFQKRVWEELAKIPYGETVSYAGLARRAGCETAVRAVGTANGKNPFAIVVPCHRVIATNGSLGGYNGGLERKSQLLALERQVTRSEKAFSF
jgi:methylated-DNA-[protein]-cysteine S-methyltransferase